MTSEKVRENRLRRTAKRRGLVLSKSRTRDPLALDYGAWTLQATGRKRAVVFTSTDLDQIEQYLNREGA